MSAEPSADLAVALLDGRDLAGPLAERTGLRVEATDDQTHLRVARRLGLDGAHVIGMAVVPWPVLPDLHAEGSASLPAYTGVVSWHAMPALLDALAQAAAPAAKAGAHVLVTASDPGAGAAPEDVIFLREVAEGIAARVGLTSRSIAWRGSTRTPTALDALKSLVEAHGRTDVVEVPVAPGTGADPQLFLAAEKLGARLVCADIGRAAQLDLLTAVIRTVAAHQDDPPDDGGVADGSEGHGP